jgi:heme O synthase-like polyprenyltransferase
MDQRMKKGNREQYALLFAIFPWQNPHFYAKTLSLRERNTFYRRSEVVVGVRFLVWGAVQVLVF